MAASGIQEHNEARRKERILMKRANWEKQFKHLNPSNEYGLGSFSGADEKPGSSYEHELISRRVGSPPGIGGHDSKSVDRQRRMDHYNRQQSESSAKINGRYKNFDYLSQW